MQQTAMSWNEVILHCLLDCNVTDCCCDDVLSQNGLKIDCFGKWVILVVVFQEGSPR